MIIEKDGTRYYDLNLFLMDNPISNMKVVQVKSTSKLYLVTGNGQLVTDYVVDYSKLTDWTLSKFIQIVRQNCSTSVDTYQEWETAFSRVTASEILNDVKPTIDKQ